MTTFSDSIQAFYKVNLYDTNGVMVAVFDAPNEITFTKELNAVGSYKMIVRGTDSRWTLFKTDSIVEIWRRVPGCQVDWYKEFEGLHRIHDWQMSEKGEVVFVSHGVGFNDLLGRANIAWKAGTIMADKNDDSAVVMCQFVNENCDQGSLINYVPYEEIVDPALYQGRFAYGVVPGFSTNMYEPPTTISDGVIYIKRGKIWTGSRSFENLLSVLQDISKYGQVDFEVKGDGLAKFRFSVYPCPDLIGEDRTVPHAPYPPSYLNRYGNAPVIFSVKSGTVLDTSYSKDTSGIANVVIMLGSGDNSTRNVYTVKDQDSVDDSPWNRHEISRAGSNYNKDLETHELTTQGYELIEDNRAKETMKFTPMQQPSQLYGKHYFIGDRVTIYNQDQEYVMRLIKVVGTVDDKGEKLTLEFEIFKYACA